MFDASCKKSWRDLWHRKLRTTTSFMAIAGSTFIMGTILVSFHYLARDMNKGFLDANPHHLALTIQGLTVAELQTLNDRDDITQLETRWVGTGRIRNARGEWKPMQLFGSDDWSHMAIDRKRGQLGAWPPNSGQVAIERQALSVLNGQLGDRVEIEINKTIYPELSVAGTVHDVVLPQAEWENIVYVYADLDTLRASGMATDVNQLLIVFADVRTRDDVVHKWKQLQSWLMARDHDIGSVAIPVPGRHPHDAFNRQMFMILKVAAGICSFFASLLLVNLISISLTGEKRIIGVMKAIGAPVRRVAWIYTTSVIILSTIATAIGMLPMVPAARLFSQYMAELLNIDLTTLAFPLWIPATLIAVGVMVPILASALPIGRASRRSIRDSMVDYGLANTSYRPSWLERLVAPRLQASHAMALRSLFRRRGRFLLNLTVLTGAGALMMTFFNFNAIIDHYIQSAKNNNQWDLFMLLSAPIDQENLARLRSQHPDTKLETQYRISGSVEGVEGHHMIITGLDPDTQMFDFTYLSGAWLKSNNDVVINQALRDALPQDVQTLVLHCDLGDYTLNIRGVVALIGGPRLFISEALFRENGITSSNRLMIASDLPPETFEPDITAALSALSNPPGFVTTVEGNIKGIVDHFEIIVRIILALTILLALIAINGIFSSISLSSLERTREIGILKAIGCSSRTLIRTMLMEGMFLGILAWAIAVVLSLPLSQLVAVQSGQVFFKSPLAFDVSLAGYAIAFLVLPALGALAGLLPARLAAQRPIRDSLVYE